MKKMATKQEKALRFGFISTARIGIKVAKGIGESSFAINYAVASRDLEKAQKFAKENDFQHAFGSYDELLNCPDIDAVYIPLPTCLKEEWAIKAAKAKKHVL